MLLEIVSIVIGFAILVWGADRFVSGAAALADNLGVAPLVIGLTVVGFGTSAPEILVSTMAALSGNAGLAIGNAIGSNIANIGLILGVTALIAPLKVHSGTLRREYPVLLGVSLFLYVLLIDGSLDRHDGVILLLGLVALLAWMAHTARASSGVDPMIAEFEAEIPHGMPIGRSLLWVAIGLAALLASSRLLVWAAVGIATEFGISDLVIGLTIVALGTSLPELAASIGAALKREHDIALGNVIGSNLYNSLAVLGVPGLVAPVAVGVEVLQRDLPVMVAFTVAIFILGRGPQQSAGQICRRDGAFLAAAFVAYQVVLFVVTSG